MRIRPATCHLVTTRVHAISTLSESNLCVLATKQLVLSTTTQPPVPPALTNSPLRVVAKSAKKDGISGHHAFNVNSDAMNLTTAKVA